MIKLHIDGKQAVLKEGTSIALTMENPFYTQSGEYTYEVELPLRGCQENGRIFGTIHSPWATLSDLARKQYTFLLKTELFELEGKAVVTAVTHEAVKVQLLSGNSALNFDSLGEVGEKYIDELELGSAYDTEWEKHHPGEKQTLYKTLTMLLSSIYTRTQRENLLHGSITNTECVCFPIYSKVDEAFANEHIVVNWGRPLEGNELGGWTSEGADYLFMIETGNLQAIPNQREGASSIVSTTLLFYAPQPYLAVIVERLLMSLGYELRPEDNALRKEWTQHVFIANARCAFDYSDCLPHWTVKEFFDELRQVFGMIVLVKGNRASIVTRHDFYATDYISIVEPIDERTTNIESEEAQQDTTSGNIAYEDSDACDPWLCIGETAYEKMDVRVVPNISSVNLNNLTQAEKEGSNILFVDENTKRRYGIFHHEGKFSLLEVDQMGPLWRDDNYEVDQHLRIVPCYMAANIPIHRNQFNYVGDPGLYKYQWVQEVPEDPTNMDLEGGESGGFFVPFLVSADTRNESTLAPYNLQKAVQYYKDTEAGDTEQNEDTTSDKNEKQNIMEVALYTGIRNNKYYVPNGSSEREVVNIPYPVGVPYYRNRKDSLPPSSEIQSLESVRNNFVLARPSSDIASMLTPPNIEIDTRVVKTITYLDNHVDPTRLYLINGKRYACQKIELRLEEDRVNPLKTGYFYEIS